MTQVDFHILKSDNRSAQMDYCCRLTEKATNQGRRVMIYTEGPEVTKHLNEQLWTFRPESFVPHTIDKSQNQKSPVFITHDADPGNFHDVLVTLHGSTPPAFFSQFERVIEVVIQEPALLKQSRENFKFYKSRGYAIKSHKVNH